ncbi:hypothetical protein UCRNP2_750 [Neofusicoccum parvum UCRNP2]|uniref:Uncharacterized protein n=1 Tax=Botryosphaeria parva (strain UCR-NP2) TaxID=1287680 RepID=R1EXI5_BOTPV|nr:hypothetical protein UCRNP2_750 [Neofusicoccum parvum UCRNP2]
MSPAYDLFSSCQDAFYGSTTAVLNRALAANVDADRDVPNIELLHGLTHAATRKANEMLEQDSMDELRGIDDAANYAAAIRAKVEAIMEQALKDLAIPGDTKLAAALEFLWDNWTAELANCVTEENAVPAAPAPPSNRTGPSQRQQNWTTDEVRFLARQFLKEPAITVRKAANLLDEHFSGKFVPHPSGGVIPFRPRSVEAVRRFTKGKKFRETLEEMKEEVKGTEEEAEKDVEEE